MTEEKNFPILLRPNELRAVYEINLAIIQSADIDAALDQIVRLTRGVFIFDHMVLYLFAEGKELEPTYARLIGRGKAAEADLAWGGEAALEACRTGKTVNQTEKLAGWEKERLFWRNILGLPLQRGEQMAGALVFGRFGGPPYEPEQISLAEFIAVLISQLLEHHRLLQKVNALEAERQLQRLQDDFIAMVSHELYTPLGFIKGYATTLLRQDANWDEENRREFLAIIDDEADRLRSLIDDLIDSYRLQSGTLHFQFQPVNLEVLLRNIIMRAVSHYEMLEIKLSTPPDLLVRGDPVRLAQVFDNLISNAVKYAPGSPIYINITDTDENYQISFQDHGQGIAEQYLSHLFDRFFRIPDENKTVHGTGLGLYICRQIIHAHSGDIWATSGQSSGTTIWITLPNTDVANTEEIDE